MTLSSRRSGIGISTVSFSDAVRSVVEEEKKIRVTGLSEVAEQRGRLDKDGEVEFQLVQSAMAFKAPKVRLSVCVRMRSDA